MIQYQFLNQIRNMANNDITNVRNQFPTIEEINGGYLIPASAIKNSKFIKEQKHRGQVFILDIYCPISYKDPIHLQ